MRLKFVGDPVSPGEDPEVLTLQGVDFPLGKWVSVDPASPLARKLAQHSHFKVETAKPASPKKPAAGGAH